MESICRGYYFINAGTFTDNNGNIISYKAYEIGYNEKISNLDINHVHTYEKVTNGTYNMVISHNPSINHFEIYGGGHVSVPICQTLIIYSKPINIGSTNLAGSSIGEVSIQYSTNNTSKMNLNSKINVQNPYKVV